MIRKIALASLALVALLAFAACEDDGSTASPTATSSGSDATATAPDVATATPADSEMSITSSAFANNETIPVKYTCDGDNVSPPLTIVGVPEEATSLALLVDDPDASGGSFVHWTVWNIDPATAEVGEGSPPAGATEGANGAGQGYTGPCPPSGEHRYIFTLYALHSVPDLDAASGKDELLAAIEGKVLAEAELIGLYERSP